jgi:Amidohydrolase
MINKKFLSLKRITIILIPILLGLFFAYSTGPDYYSMADFATVQKADVHVHINSSNPAFLKQAKADNFKLLTINADYSDFPPIERQKEIAIQLKKEYPSQLAFVATFHMSGWDGPGWKEKTIRQLDNTFDEGAIAVKIWKNIGMEFRDKDGNLVMIDDPGFDPIFAHLQQKNIPLIGHQGEPKNCWLPIDQMTVNNDKSYFKHHPQYYMYLHPEMLSYEELMAARDRMLKKNMNIKFVGAHLASLEWSVDELGKFLDYFPNAIVDMAARMGQVQYQSQHDREKVRQFFVKYQDRILYATDETQEPGLKSQEFKKEIHKKWLRDWKYMNTDSTMKVPQLDAEIQGLKLPKDVVTKIYFTNAEKAFPNAWRNNSKRLA